MVSCLIQCSLGPKSLHPMQDLESSIHLAVLSKTGQRRRNMSES